MTAPRPPRPAYLLGNPSGSLKQTPDIAPSSSAPIPTPQIPTFFPNSEKSSLYTPYNPFPDHLFAFMNSVPSFVTLSK